MERGEGGADGSEVGVGGVVEVVGVERVTWKWVRYGKRMMVRGVCTL